jgi:hypothetical protein
MGSSSAGVSMMAVGVTAGSTWKDEECIRRLNARELANTLKEYDAAKELLCGNPEINEVYRALGRPCLLTASNSVVVTGGALPNYREPVAPRPAQITHKLTDEEKQAIKEDVNRTDKEKKKAELDAKLIAAEIARQQMAERGY